MTQGRVYDYTILEGPPDRGVKVQRRKQSAGQRLPAGHRLRRAGSRPRRDDLHGRVGPRLTSPAIAHRYRASIDCSVRRNLS